MNWMPIGSTGSTTPVDGTTNTDTSTGAKPKTDDLTNRDTFLKLL